MNTREPSTMSSGDDSDSHRDEIEARVLPTRKDLHCSVVLTCPQKCPGRLLLLPSAIPNMIFTRRSVKATHSEDKK